MKSSTMLVLAGAALVGLYLYSKNAAAAGGATDTTGLTIGGALPGGTTAPQDQAAASSQGYTAASRAMTGTTTQQYLKQPVQFTTGRGSTLRNVSITPVVTILPGGSGQLQATQNTVTNLSAGFVNKMRQAGLIA